jgi:hypothetical protein
VRIAGEGAKVGLSVSAASVRATLRRQGLGPASRRGGPSWAEFLRAQAVGVHSSADGDSQAQSDRHDPCPPGPPSSRLKRQDKAPKRQEILLR